MKLFLDTNIMIDLMTERMPYYYDVAKIITLAEQRKITLTASSLSFVTCNYLITKLSDYKTATEILKKFRIICNVSNVDEIDIDKSLFSKFKDFEDAVQYHSALHHQCEIIITRNGKDFKNAEIPVMTATEFLVIFNNI
jgi:predicted nucleic acid-binding protein